MKSPVYLMLIMFVIGLTSCTQKEKTIKYTIASQRADCMGVAPRKCLLIKTGDQTDWQFFYSDIEGFDYVEGYEYVLEVREEPLSNVPADASSIKYILVKEISKTHKTSENLPVSPKADTGIIQLVGKVLHIEKTDVGQGAASGMIPVTVIEVEVSSTTSGTFKAGDIVYCELISSPTVTPVIGREYVFKAKDIHLAHARGIYLLETNVQDLVV